MERTAKALTDKYLQSAGICINGKASWDIQIHNDHFYSRVLKDGSLGLGEAYMDGWWSCEQLDLFFERIIKSKINNNLKTNLRLFFKLALWKMVNLQTKKRSLEVGRKHYDLGNDLFNYMLDKNMNYSCGYWKDAANLDDAQINKLELSCQKLMLKPGMRVLDIGCGFGSFAKYAAKNFGVNVVGITISQQQYEYAKQNCSGLPIEIRFQDYRDVDVNNKFDRIISIGMFEHVGHTNYRTYMKMIERCLTDDGLFLLHTIGSNVSSTLGDEWIARYIFPNGILPSIAQIAKASEGLFVMEDWHNFGAYYDKTLLAWHANFNQHWEFLKKKYDDRFYRMWNYYLLACAGAFRARDIQLWQIVLSKHGMTGGYQLSR